MISDDRTPVPPRKPEGETISHGLYLVATPIGNLADMTFRAVSTLRAADVIACEDTRVSLKLLNAYEIKKPLIAYHDHNAEEMRPKLLRQLKEGRTIALISDAGTPLLSDPGYKLVQACIEAEIDVITIPGASALLAGISLAGLPMERFFFAGFLPVKEAARKAALRDLLMIPATLVFYEAPQRLVESLKSIAAILGDRRASVSRELTKKFEATKRGQLSDLALYYENNPPKGEIVIVVGPPEAEPSEMDFDDALASAIAETSLKQAVAQISAEHGLPRRTVYARALALTGKNR